jgi:hypothetical protein
VRRVNKYRRKNWTLFWNDTGTPGMLSQPS